MQIREIEGDALSSADRYLVHQTNCLGVMGAGIARQIREKWPKVYKDYKAYCIENGSKNCLGHTQFLLAQSNPEKIVCNLFGEYSYSEADAVFPDGRHTDFEAFRSAMNEVKAYVLEDIRLRYITPEQACISMPYRIGAGLAGGRTEEVKLQTWNKVLQIIIDTFNDTDFVITLWKYSK